MQALHHPSNARRLGLRGRHAYPAIALIILFLTSNVIKTHRRKVSTGAEALINETGTAQCEIPAHGEGQVFVSGELWTAVNGTDEPIASGDRIKITKVDNVTLIVSKEK